MTCDRCGIESDWNCYVELLVAPNMPGHVTGYELCAECVVGVARETLAYMEDA